MKLQEKPKLYKPYSKGVYNKCKGNEQWIRISEGCPNFCSYCREGLENGAKPIYYDIPKIEKNKVKIIDMNLIYKPKALEIINNLGYIKVNSKVVYYELLCGIDYRYMTQELSNALYKNRFKNIRLAWDHSIKEQYKIKDCINMLKKSGYKAKEIMIFIICNWKISYEENLMKMDLCKIWGVQLSDNYFDNQLMPNVKPIHWTLKQIKDYRKKSRLHNQIINFEIYPEIKQIISKNQKTLI